jgi:hypothetical protein
MATSPEMANLVTGQKANNWLNDGRRLRGELPRQMVAQVPRGELANATT